MAAPKNRGLGKGLEALFGEIEVDFEDNEDANLSENKSDNPSGNTVKREKSNDSKRATADENGVLSIDINDIKPNEDQPRTVFNEEKLQELADSITAHGIIQPIVLRKSGEGYEIVAGERRWRAARLAGLKKVPCIIKELTDEQNMLVAIIENMQRENLNPVEEAEGLQKMSEVYGLTQEQISKGVGKSRPYITNALRLLKLPEEVRELISADKLSAGHGRAIAGLTDSEKQIEIAKRTVNGGLSVRALEKLISDTKKPATKKPAKAKKTSKDPNLAEVEQSLKATLGTKVNILSDGKKGKIEIEYYSDEERERLIELLKSL